LHFQGLAVPVAGSPLARASPHSELAFVIGHREITRLPFRLAGEPEILAALKVTALTLDTQRKSGQWRTQVTRLESSDCRSFRISAAFVAGILAPNVIVEARVLLLQDGILLGQADFSFRLDQPEHHISSKPIPAECLHGGSGAAGRELALEIRIGDQSKAVRSFPLIPEHITDFEGQLTLDPSELAVDEAEYQRILSQL
jgi:hypothetical protein